MARYKKDPDLITITVPKDYDLGRNEIILKCTKNANRYHIQVRYYDKYGNSECDNYNMTDDAEELILNLKTCRLTCEPLNAQL